MRSRLKVEVEVEVRGEEEEGCEKVLGLGGSCKVN